MHMNSALSFDVRRARRPNDAIMGKTIEELRRESHELEASRREKFVAVMKFAEMEARLATAAVDGDRWEGKSSEELDDTDRFLQQMYQDIRLQTERGRDLDACVRTMSRFTNYKATIRAEDHSMGNRIDRTTDKMMKEYFYFIKQDTDPRALEDLEIVIRYRLKAGIR